jgi:hypothetical protein
MKQFLQTLFYVAVGQEKTYKDLKIINKKLYYNKCRIYMFLLIEVLFVILCSYYTGKERKPMQSLRIKSRDITIIEDFFN